MLSEIAVIHGIQSWFSGAWGTALVIFLSRWLIFFYAPLVVFFALSRRRVPLRYTVVEVAWSGLLGFSMAMAIGRLIGRVRPFRASPDVSLLIPPPASTYALPSGHAATAFAIAAALAFADPVLGAVALVMAVLIAFGRVAAGVHYPSDVLAGAILGIICALTVRYVHHAWRKRAEKKSA